MKCNVVLSKYVSQQKLSSKMSSFFGTRTIETRSGWRIKKDLEETVIG